MPAGAGTPRYEKRELWFGTGVVRAPYPSPSWGQAPALHFSFGPRLSLFGRRWLVPPAGAGTPRIGTVDSAEPHPDPCGGQAPRLAKSSTALHFLIPPSAIGLQFGTFRRWRAGIEVDWRAHSGTNDTHETGPPKSEQLRRPYSVFQPAPGSA